QFRRNTRLRRLNLCIHSKHKSAKSKRCNDFFHFFEFIIFTNSSNLNQLFKPNVKLGNFKPLISNFRLLNSNFIRADISGCSGVPSRLRTRPKPYTSRPQTHYQKTIRLTNSKTTPSLYEDQLIPPETLLLLLRL